MVGASNTINIFRGQSLDYLNIYRIKPFSALLDFVGNRVVFTDFVDKAR